MKPERTGQLVPSGTTNTSTSTSPVSIPKPNPRHSNLDFYLDFASSTPISEPPPSDQSPSA